MPAYLNKLNIHTNKSWQTSTHFDEYICILLLSKLYSPVGFAQKVTTENTVS
jgi:hypothetical protein